ncbi:hypothetical protein [uncultured Paludibaculum sp.]|uniref:hypothetical protein n=1 Tax=uncultured Paludibaculum sp. TaxID=1765020 RepID=UPI002AAC189E|nr:hypothetical protein [uncultured Paludibaculum sp.]
MEFIGLLIAGVLFFALSVLIGCVYGGIAWLILRSRREFRKFRWAAVCLPPIFAAYMVACAVVFALSIPGEGDRIFFGDLYERLPNGYTLKAMAKMPTYGMIQNDSITVPHSVNGWVSRVAVDGPFVFGAYSDKEGYFVLDTRTGKNFDLATIAELDRQAGHPVRLADIFSFRGSDGRGSFLLAVERWIWFGPPLICSLLYFGFLVRLRRQDSRGALIRV